MYRTFHIETNARGVPVDWRSFPTKVMNSDNATPNERLLAAHMLQLADVIDRVVESLNYGTATAIVHESDIRIVRDGR
jgi:hypothetical protein